MAKYALEHPRTCNFFQNSFNLKASKLWNSLPIDLRGAKKSAKHYLYEYLLEK